MIVAVAKAIVLGGVGVILSLGISACGGGADPAPVDAAPLYAQHCAACHGMKGEGGVGLPIGGGVLVRTYPDVDDEVEVVRKGRGSMPPFGNVLSHAEIDALVEYTRTRLG